MYAWGVHAVGGRGVAVAAGVTRERSRAQQQAGDAFAASPGAVLAVVEAVHLSPGRHAEYERCGVTWLASRDAQGLARWDALPLEARR